MGQNLGVGLADELITALLEFRFQLAVVVNLSVLKRDNLIAATKERLRSSFNIDDR